MATNVSDDLWRECTAWLTRCKAIPADHKANWADSEIRVLALTLRDGVILCNLLNSIDPNALDMKDFNRKPQMAQVRFSYSTYKNTFLHFLDFFIHKQFSTLTPTSFLMIRFSHSLFDLITRKILHLHWKIPSTFLVHVYCFVLHRNSFFSKNGFSYHIIVELIHFD